MSTYLSLKIVCNSRTWSFILINFNCVPKSNCEDSMGTWLGILSHSAWPGRLTESFPLPSSFKQLLSLQESLFLESLLFPCVAQATSGILMLKFFFYFKNRACIFQTLSLCVQAWDRGAKNKLRPSLLAPRDNHSSKQTLSKYKYLQCWLQKITLILLQVC